MTAALIPLNKGRSGLDPVADHSRDQRNRGRVSHSALPKAALDNTPAAIRSPKDRIATGDHTPRGVPRSCAAKRHTELRAAAAEADRNQLAGHSGRLMAAGNRKADCRPVAGHTRLTGCSQVAGHKRKKDRTPVAGCTRLTGYSWVAAHSQVPAHRQKADHRREVHPPLRRGQEKLRRRAALPW
jgi:hypothetical protein